MIFNFILKRKGITSDVYCCLLVEKIPINVVFDVWEIDVFYFIFITGAKRFTSRRLAVKA